MVIADCSADVTGARRKRRSVFKCLKKRFANLELYLVKISFRDKGETGTFPKENEENLYLADRS